MAVCKNLQCIVRIAEKFIGSYLLQDIFHKRWTSRASSFVDDPSQPSHDLFTLLPTGRRYKSNTFFFASRLTTDQPSVSSTPHNYTASRYSVHRTQSPYHRLLHQTIYSINVLIETAAAIGLLTPTSFLPNQSVSNVLSNCTHVRVHPYSSCFPVWPAGVTDHPIFCSPGLVCFTNPSVFPCSPVHHVSVWPECTAES